MLTVFYMCVAVKGVYGRRVLPIVHMRLPCDYRVLGRLVLAVLCAAVKGVW